MTTSERKRRGHGEGGIRQRADGRWEASLRLAGGLRRYWYAATRREVQEQLTAALRDRDRGMPLPGGRQTLAQFLESWLDTVGTPTLRPRTLEGYRVLARLHLLPYLGKKELRKLTPQDLQRVYAEKLASGLAPRTVGHCHRFLHRALEDAMRWGLVPRNICDLISPPRVPQMEMRALSPAQCQEFLHAAEGDAFEALYVLALTTGMRQGELLALKWGDIDLSTGTLQVRRSIARLTGQGFVESEPKTAKSRRSISLMGMAVDALRRHRQRQIETRLAVGPAWEEHGLVFCNSLGRPLERQSVTQRSFRPLLDKAELPHIRFHDLRHSAASLLLSLGIHPKVVQEMLGHAQIGITMDTYSHVMPALQREAVDTVERFLRGGR